MSALTELQKVYALWEKEQGETVDVLEAVGKYLKTLKPKVKRKRSTVKPKGDSLDGWNRIIQEHHNRKD